ncbi:hypothetical protein D3C80_2004740 [compost metagenome]
MFSDSVTLQTFKGIALQALPGTKRASASAIPFIKMEPLPAVILGVEPAKPLGIRRSTTARTLKETPTTTPVTSTAVTDPSGAHG